MTDGEKTAADQLAKLVAEAKEEERELKAKLLKVRNRIRILNETVIKLTGKTSEESEEKSIPDLLEEILRRNGKPTHVDDLLLTLKHDYQMHSVGKQTLSGALIRYASQGRRFKRAGKNTFTLLEEEEEELMDKN